MTIKPANALLLTAALAFGALIDTGAARAADAFTLSSSAFKDGEPLAKKVGDVPARGPNCKGERIA